MKKNIIILILFVVIAFLLIRDRVTQDNIESTPEVTSENTVNTPKVTPDEPKDTGDSLDISGKGLTNLPSYVLDRTSLRELDISDNNLTGALPGEIRHLKSLRVLDASDNKMTGVPAEIGQLEKLEVLDLSNNSLTGLPYEMGNLKSLKKLDLSGNDYSERDLDVIKQSLPSDVEIVY